MDVKTLNLVQAALVKHPQLGERVVNIVKQAVPGKAKFAVLNKEQRTWLFNALKRKEVQDSGLSLAKNSDDVIVSNPSKLLAALGGEDVGVSASVASGSTVKAAAVVTSEADVANPVPKAISAPASGNSTPVKRKLPAEVAKPNRTPGMLFGRRRNAAQDLAKRILHHSGGKRHLATSLVRKVLQRMDSTFKGIKQELLRDEPAVDNLLLRTLGNLRKAAVENGFQTISIADLDFAMSNARQWPRRFLKRHGYMQPFKQGPRKTSHVRSHVSVRRGI